MFFLSHNIILDNVPVILSMEDLGYSESHIKDISLKSFKDYDLYKLVLSSSKDDSLDENEYIRIEIFNTDNKSNADTLLADEMKSYKKAEMEWRLNSNNYKNEINIETDFFRLDENEWKVEKAYALYDYNNYPEDRYYDNYIFLKKGSRVMVIEFDPEFEMSPSRIDVLKALIDTDVFKN
ncbi:MAG: hypothetical protein SOW61_00220 [Erysipelotrichaceae bacterium]|nr:hypothetical protein [Erysipelotrichaceae bacterium]